MKWNKDTKEVIAYIFAAVALVFGLALTFAGFLVIPTGIVDQSVLWALGQCLAFAGGITGISLQIDNAKQHIKAELKDEFLKKDM